MKAIGNYRAATPTEERRVGEVVLFKGNRAMVRFPGTLAFSMPADDFRRLGITEGQHFVLIVRRLRGAVLERPRIEPHAPARPVIDRKATPKVMVRDGRKLATRR